MVRHVIRMYHRAYVGLPKEVWMLSGALFVNRFGTMVLPFFTLYLTGELGYQEAAAGRMLSIYGVGAILGAYTVGRLIQPLGAIRSQILFFLLAVPIYLTIPLFETWWAIALGMFTLSFFCEGIRPANSVAITQFTPKELQVRAFGLQRMALNLGVSFGPAIGGVLATIGFYWLFIADATTTLLCAGLMIYFFGFQRYSKTKSVQEQQNVDQNKTGSPLKDPLCLIFLGLTFMTSLIFSQFYVAYPLFLTEHYHLTKPMIGLIFSVNTVIIVIFEMLLLEYIRRKRQLVVVGFGALISCLGFGILPFGSSVVYCIFSMIVITVGEMLWLPIATGWIAQRSHRGNKGMYMSWYTITYSLSAIFAPLVGGAVYQYDQNLLWYISIAVGLMMLIGFLLLQKLTAKEARIESESQ